MTPEHILLDASRALSALDRAKENLRVAEANVAQVRRRYDMATGTRGIRVEGLRNAVEARYGKRSA